MEYNNVIFSANYVYASLGANNASQLTSFKFLSNESYSIYGGISHEYSGTILTSHSQEFTSHQSFMNAVNSSTGILTCMEMYNVYGGDYDAVSLTQIIYLSSDVMNSKGINTTTLSHTDFELMPDIVKGEKTL